MIVPRLRGHLDGNKQAGYAYAGSFYAFSIWCGLGVAAIIDWLKKLGLKNTAVTAAAAVACLLVPVQMASQNWDDHDRSGRYTCRDFGQNYLMSLPKDGYPIIFTNGDNDTFPLWYNQETEGVRTDARVCNLSYLQTDWYIDQMVRPAYDSPSLPIKWPRIDYCSGTNDAVTVRPELKEAIRELYEKYPEEAHKALGDKPFEVSNVLKLWVRDAVTPEQRNIKNTLLQYVGLEPNAHVVPTDTLLMTIDKDAVRKSGMKLLSDSIPDQMVISLSGHRTLGKGDLMILEMLSQANWTRPIYVAITVGEENYMNLGDNLIQEGLASRITPFTTRGSDEKFDTDKVYDHMMNDFKYGGLDKKGIYLDQTVARMCATHRRLFAQLALALVNEGKTDKAAKALAKMEKEIPDYNLPMEYMNGGLDLVKAYGALGNKKRATEIANDLWKISQQYLSWYMQQSPSYFMTSQSDCQMHIVILYNLIGTMDEVDQKWGDAHESQLQSLLGTFQQLGGQLPM